MVLRASSCLRALSTAAIKLGWITLSGRVASGNKTTPELPVTHISHKLQIKQVHINM